MGATSGLASAIRSSTASATFDLAGSDASAIRSSASDALSAPLALPGGVEMIRLTFVVR